ARVRAERRFTLHCNHRAESRLVAALNRLFGRHTNPFLLEAIAFDEVDASGKRDQTPLRVNGRSESPLKMWVWRGDGPIKLAEARRQLPAVCAAAISRLLQADAAIGEQPVRPPDIAVLVATHWQGRAVQSALDSLRIPSALLSDQNVFHTDEARELQAILAAVAEPGRDPLVRAALCTDVLGYGAADLDALAGDERAAEETLLRFKDYHDRWAGAGFIQMFRSLLQGEKVRARLLQWPDGERRLTNLLHLGELLHGEASSRRLSLSGLLKWLHGQRTRSAGAREETLLRLERDEDAIQIITMHRSKGLQFPIVFCPFSYGESKRKGEWQRVIFHDAGHDDRLTLDLGTDNQATHKALVEHERLAEQIRLFYVALTRARHACHFVWGRFHTCEVSAGAWLLHAPPDSEQDAVPHLRQHMKALTRETFERDLERLRNEAGGSIEISDLPAASASPWYPAAGTPQAGTARAFTRTIARDWRIGSFTSLTENRDTEEPDYDPASVSRAPEEPVVALTGIHAFPRGKKPGACLHEIFEELDFTQPAQVEELVRRKLTAFSFDRAEWTESVVDCVRRTLDVELSPGLRLSRIPKSARLSELEFHLPVGALDAASLLRALGPEAAGRLQFDPWRGVLKGFIDLVFEHGGRFYLLDWKSNQLGPDTSAYEPETLAAVMSHHRYRLQYLLYTVALHRFLALRLRGYQYERHFGGVSYLFLRGIDPSQPRLGVFRDTPAPKVIKALDTLFQRQPRKGAPSSRDEQNLWLPGF
nr:PD-(D/E)XK nuclease family protein [Verrucomicrobiota bacterium]